jgi:ABC-2 type transport system ATP-binding protein
VDEIAKAADVLSRFTDGELQIEEESKSLIAPIESARVFTRAVGAIEDAGIEVHDVGLRRPTLNDVFLTLTGHHADPEEEADDRQTEAPA